MIKLEDFRDFVLDDLYGIAPCTNPILDTLIDTCFEYSILVNLLLVGLFITYILHVTAKIYIGCEKLSTAIFDQTKPLYLTNQNSLYFCVNQ